VEETERTATGRAGGRESALGLRSSGPAGEAAFLESKGFDDSESLSSSSRRRRFTSRAPLSSLPPPPLPPDPAGDPPRCVCVRA